MPPTNAQYDAQLEMLAQIVEIKATNGYEAANIIRSFKTTKVSCESKEDQKQE